MITHAMLVEVAAQWLKRRCAVVITEMHTIGECADAIGWRGPHSILVECKTNIEDYRADAGKLFRRLGESGRGDVRYFMTISGLISLNSLPDRWGLLEINGKCVRVMKAALPFKDVNKAHEIGVLLSALRRAAQPTKGVSVRVYVHETHKTSSLSVEPESEAMSDV